VPDAVGVENVCAQVMEESRHGAFSARDASGKAEGESEVRSPRFEVSYLQAALPSHQKWAIRSRAEKQVKRQSAKVKRSTASRLQLSMKPLPKF